MINILNLHGVQLLKVNGKSFNLSQFYHGIYILAYKLDSVVWKDSSIRKIQPHWNFRLSN